MTGKRLYRGLLKRWAALTWPAHGCKVKNYQNVQFLLNWKSLVDREVGLYGGYEKAQVAFLLSQMSQGCDLFFDIGAQFGLYSLQVVKSGLANEVHAFEPDLRNIAQMQGNLYLNKMTGVIQMHAVAVSDKNGMLEFDLCPDTSTDQSSVSSGGANTTALPAITLDASFDLKEKSIFFKIDVVGHELAVLKGAADLLQRNRCFLQVESTPQNAPNVMAFMKDLGYELINQIDRDYYFRKAGAGGESLARTPVGTVRKNIIMCLTTGRSGTNLLQKLLALTDDTCALHEPEPAFQSALADVSRDPEAAVFFVRNRKLPYILSRTEKNYAETSHVFGKGFFEAFITLEIPFRLIILDREPREVAKSHWRTRIVPRRTRLGREFLLDPAQRDVLSPKRWQLMTNYQLCYWYCLEVERRKTLYMKECRERGIPVVEISLDQLKDWNRFQQLCMTCGLTLPDSAKTAYDGIVADKVNAKSEHLEKSPLIPFAWQEKKVWKALGKEGKALRAEVEARYHARQEKI